MLEDALIWPRFAQDELRVDPEALWADLCQIPTWPSDTPIPIPEHGEELHWIDGSNDNLHMRGNPIKRGKIWIQGGDYKKGVVRYRYPGWQYGIAPATHALEYSPPAFQALVERLNDGLARSGHGPHNHWIITRYQDERHIIGPHSDDDDDFVENSYFVVIKLGASRDFAFHVGGDKPFFRQTLDAGTAVFVRCKAPGAANDRVKHSVPAMLMPVGLSGSVVSRAIATILPWDVIKKHRPSAKGRAGVSQAATHTTTKGMSMPLHDETLPNPAANGAEPAPPSKSFVYPGAGGPTVPASYQYGMTTSAPLSAPAAVPAPLPPQKPFIFSPPSSSSPPVPSPTNMPPVTTTPLRKELRVQTWAEFESEAATVNSSFLWEGIIPSTGIVLMAGESLAGKSILTVLLGTAAQQTATTTQVAGLEVEEAKFLFATLEHKRSTFRDYVLWASKTHGVTSSSLCVVEDLDIGDPEMLKAFDEQATAHGINVIVIDCLRRATTLDENVSSDTARIGAALQKLTNKGTRLVIVVHHVGKDGSVRGSTDLTAMADTVVTLRKRGEDVEIHARHHGAPEKRILVRFDFTDGGLSVIASDASPTSAAGSAATPSVQLDAILLAVTRGARTTTVIRDEVRKILQGQGYGGISQQAVTDGLRDLEAASRVKNQGTTQRHDWVVIGPPPVPAADAPLPSSSSAASAPLGSSVDGAPNALVRRPERAVDDGPSDAPT